MKKFILLFILLFAFKSYSYNLALEMMKSSAIQQMKNDSELANQMTSMMMQQKALEARERELFQKFQYEKELQRESRQYQNQLEIIRQKNKEIQKEERLEKKMSAMRNEEKDLYELHNYVANQVYFIHQIIKIIDSNEYHSALIKIQKRMKKKYGLNLLPTNLNKISKEISYLVLTNMITDNELLSLNKIVDEITIFTTLILQNHKFNFNMIQSIQLINESFLKGQYDLKKTFQNINSEFINIYKKSFDARNAMLKNHPYRKYSIIENKHFFPEKFLKN